MSQITETQPFQTSDQKNNRIMFSGMKSNKKLTQQQQPEIQLKNTFQNDLDTFKRLFSDTKNSRLMTPAKFNKLQIIEEDQSNEHQQNVSNDMNKKLQFSINRQDDNLSFCAKKCYSYREAMSKLKIKQLSSLQKEIYQAIHNEKQNENNIEKKLNKKANSKTEEQENMICQLNNQCGKFVLLKLLALTMQKPAIVFITNQIEYVKNKFKDEKDLNIEYHTREEENSKMGRKLQCQDIDILFQTFEMFLNSEIRHSKETMIIIDYQNIRVLNQIMIERVNIKYLTEHKDNKCIVLTDIIGRSMMMDLWEKLDIQQVIPEQISIENIEDTSNNRLVKVDKVLQCKYEESQWKSLVGLIREKEEKSKHMIYILCGNRVEAQHIYRQLLSSGVKCRLQKNKDSQERGVVVGTFNKTISPQLCSYVFIYSLPLSLEVYLSYLQHFDRSTLIISLVSPNHYISIRNQIQCTYIPSGKLIALLQALLNPSLTHNHQVSNTLLSQQEGGGLLVHKLKDLSEETGVESSQLLKVIEYMNLVDHSIETYSLVPLSCQILATQPIQQVIKDFPSIRGALSTGHLVGTHSIRFKTIEAALDQDSDVNSFMNDLHKGAKQGLYQLKTYEQLWFYKVLKEADQSFMLNKAIQMAKAFNYTVYEKRKQLDISYLYQSQFSFNSVENLITHLKYRGECRFVKEKERLLEEYLGLKDNKESLLTYLRHYQSDGNYKNKLGGVQLSSQREKSLFQQDVMSVLVESFEMVNLTSYHIVGESLERSQLNDVISYNLIRILIGVHTQADHEHSKTLKLFAKYRDYDIQDMQLIIYEVVQQFIKENQDFEDDVNFSGKALKKVKK